MITTIQSFNWKSAAFWSSVAGAAAMVMGILNINSAMIRSVQDVLVAVGGLMVAIPVHHVVKAQVTTPKPPQTGL